MAFVPVKGSHEKQKELWIRYDFFNPLAGNAYRPVTWTLEQQRNPRVRFDTFE